MSVFVKIVDSVFLYSGECVVVHKDGIDVVRRNTHGNTDSNTETNSGPVTTATIPYISGTSETIARPRAPLTYFIDGGVRRIFLGLTFWPKGIFLGL